MLSLLFCAGGTAHRRHDPVRPKIRAATVLTFCGERKIQGCRWDRKTIGWHARLVEFLNAGKLLWRTGSRPVKLSRSRRLCRDEGRQDRAQRDSV